MNNTSQNYTYQEIINYWKENNVYKFNPNNLNNIFSIDTPPPTISGNLHIGHIFSYSHTDFIARFNRMQGKNVFYPIGFDNNGLPTEKLVEKKFNKKARDYCSTEQFYEKCLEIIDYSTEQFKSLFYQIGFSFDFTLNYSSISNQAKKIACISFFDLYQKQKIYFKQEPVLWDIVDQTAISQAEIEDKEIEGIMFEIQFLIEDQNESDIEKWQKTTIATSRPELLANCCCVFAHPDDLMPEGRFAHLSKAWLISPVFFSRIPVLADEKVIKDKGTGLVMCCLFGDELDVEWNNKYKNNLNEIPQKEKTLADIFNCKPIIAFDGTIELLQANFLSLSSTNAIDKIKNYFGWPQILNIAKENNSHKSKYKIKEWREIIIDLLQVTNDSCDKYQWEIQPQNHIPALINSYKITQYVKCAERSGSKLEIIPTPQWYVKIKNESNTWLEISQQLNWIPSHIQEKLKAWINSLSYDWCASRQRFWGIRFPVKLLRKIEENHQETEQNIETKPSDLIIMWDYHNIFDDELFFNIFIKNDTTIEEHNGIFSTKAEYYCPYDVYNISGQLIYQKNQIMLHPGEKFTLLEDKNVMDTWFTSSLTPQINSSLLFNEKDLNFQQILNIIQNNNKFLPMDLRPQSHEIIRTWAFYTIVKSHYHSQIIPWKNIMISGWCLSSSGQKMSKSKDNIIDPVKIIEQYGPDVVRYWASNANLGSDSKYDENIFKIGKKLVTKIENAFKFLMQFKESIKKLMIWNLKNSYINKSKDSLNNLELIDQYFLQNCNKLIEQSTKYWNQFNYFKAMQITEEFFWKDFCDSHLEIAKVRAYGQYEGVNSQMQKSALFSLLVEFEILLKLFAPILPFITEKIYSQMQESFSNNINQAPFQSIHSNHNWPTLNNLNNVVDIENIGQIFNEILQIVRKFKSLQQVSPKQTITLKIYDTTNILINHLDKITFDLTHVCHITNLYIEQGLIEDKTEFPNQQNKFLIYNDQIGLEIKIAQQ